MLLINNALCYSPFPPERYAKNGMGHGPFCKDDIQLWNLMWLSIPDVDRYLQDHYNAQKVFDSIPLGMGGGVIAALTGENCKAMFPKLRLALMKDPMLFLADLWGMDWQYMPMYLHDKGWLKVVEQRAREVGLAKEAERVEEVLYRKENVVRVQFGRPA